MKKVSLAFLFSLFLLKADAGVKVDSTGGVSGLTGVTSGGVLYSDGAGGVTGSGVLTNGQLLIGDGTTAPTAAALTGTSNQVTVTNGAGSITLSTPQDIGTTSTVRHAKLGLGIAADSDHVISVNTVQSIASNHLQNEIHMEGTGTGSREINGAVVEAVYNQSGGTHSGALNGLYGLFEIANGTQSGEVVGVHSFGYVGVAAGATISSNTYQFKAATLDLAGGGTYNAPIYGYYIEPFPSAWAGPKYYFYSKYGGTGHAAFLGRGGYSIFNDAMSASSFTVRGSGVSNLFHVDGTNDRVGVGATAPATKLHLSSGIFTMDGTTPYITYTHVATSPTATATQASIWAVNVNSSAEMKVIDGAGNITQISPHDPTTGKWMFDSFNEKTGRHVRVPDMEKVIRLLESLTGESLMEVTYSKPRRTQ